MSRSDVVGGITGPIQGVLVTNVFVTTQGRAVVLTWASVRLDLAHSLLIGPVVGRTPTPGRLSGSRPTGGPPSAPTTASKPSIASPESKVPTRKGGVEGQIGWFRRNHLVPIPELDSLDELNAMVDAWDEADDARRNDTAASRRIGTLPLRGEGHCRFAAL